MRGGDAARRGVRTGRGRGERGGGGGATDARRRFRIRWLLCIRIGLDGAAADRRAQPAEAIRRRAHIRCAGSDNSLHPFSELPRPASVTGEGVCRLVEVVSNKGPRTGSHGLPKADAPALSEHTPQRFVSSSVFDTVAHIDSLVSSLRLPRARRTLFRRACRLWCGAARCLGCWE